MFVKKSNKTNFTFKDPTNCQTNETFFINNKIEKRKNNIEKKWEKGNMKNE